MLSMNWDHCSLRTVESSREEFMFFELMPVGNMKLKVMQKTVHVSRAMTRSWRCTQVTAQHPAGHGVCLPSTIGRIPSQPCSQGRAAPEVQSGGDLGTARHGHWCPHGAWQWPWCSHRQLWGQAANVYGHPGLGSKTCDSTHGDHSKETDWSACLPLQEMGFKRDGWNSWIGKIPWRRKWQPTPAFSPGKSHEERSLVRCSPWSHKKSRHDWAEQQKRGDRHTFKRHFRK